MNLKNIYSVRRPFFFFLIKKQLESNNYTTNLFRTTKLISSNFSYVLENDAGFKDSTFPYLTQWNNRVWQQDDIFVYYSENFLTRFSTM